MRHRLCGALLSALISLSFGGTVSAQWVQLNSPYAGTLNFVTNFNGNLYAGSFNFLNANVFRSTDGGSTWNDFNGGVKGIEPSSSAAFSGDLYFLSAGKDIYRSAGGSGNWQQLDSGLNGKSGMVYLAVLPSALVLAANNLSCYVLDPQTERWTRRDTGVGGIKQLTSVVSHGGLLVATTTGKGVLTSADSGATWQSANAGLFTTYMDGCVVQGDEIIAKVGLADSLYATTDNGASWTMRGIAPKGTNRNIVSDGVHLYAYAQNQGLSRSDDSGRSWKKVGAGIYSLGIQSISATPSVVAVGTNAGLFISTDLGFSFMQAVIASSHFFTNVQSMCESQGVLYAATASSGVYRSFDQGVHFSAADLGFQFGGVTALTPHDNAVYCGSGRVYRTLDSGSTWTRTDTLSTKSPTNASALIFMGNTLYAASNNTGVLASTDNGFTWAFDTVGLSRKSFTSFATSGDTILLGSTTGLFFSTDAGAHWVRSNSGLPDSNIQAVVAFGGSHFVGTQSGLFRSDDNGNTWNPAMQYVNIKTLAVSGDTLFAGGDGIYISTDGGMSWDPDGNDASGVTVSSFTSDGLYMYAGTTTTGVWRRSISPLAVRDQNGKSPSFTIAAYPNPFAGELHLQLSCPEPTEASLKIVDVLGRALYEGGRKIYPAGQSEIALNTTQFSIGTLYAVFTLADGSTQVIALRKQ